MEKVIKPSSGYLMLFIALAAIGLSIYSFFLGLPYGIEGGILLVTALICMAGFFIVDPNKAMVLLLFGEYKGTVKANGFFWVNPFMSKKKISLFE